MPITLGNNDINGPTGAFIMPNTNDSSFVGPVIRNFGTGSGNVAGMYFQAYDWVQGGIWHGRGATGTERSGALVLGTNPNTADLTKQGLVGRVIIDNAGRVRMPNQPYALVTFTNNSNILFASNSVISFNTGEQRGGHFNTSTHLFTAPVGGLYHVFCSLMLNPPSSNTNRLVLRKNGSEYLIPGGFDVIQPAHGVAGSGVSSPQSNINLTAIINLSAGDTVGFFSRGGSSVGPIYAGHSWGSFHLIG